MNPKAATAPLELAPDPVLASEAVFVVGLTREGQVPLIVSSEDGARPLSAVRLPGLADYRPLDPLPSLHRRLREEAGVDAPELVVMSRYGIPTGERGRATILLAPFAQTFPRDGMRSVPLGELTGWLSRCRTEGIRVDPRVWVGLLLAERHFPRWAQTRLRAAVEELQRRRFVTAAAPPGLP
jgi:hypothetical protein